jgi:polyhydroxybutyrate depolymerase
VRWSQSVAVAVVATVVLSACSSGDTVGSATDTTATGASAGCASPDSELARTGDDGTFTSDGEERTFTLAVPSDAAPTEPVPLVVSLHGASSSSAIHENSVRLAPLSEEEGFAVLTPQARGASRTWDIQPEGPDVRFVEELLDHVESGLCIDTNRVYLTGFSMGGILSTVLACRDSERYAAIAPVAGLVQVDGCESTTPVPLLAMHGTADKTIGFDGTVSPSVALLVGSSTGPSRADLVAAWAESNGCDTGATSTRIEPDVVHLTYACPPDGSVEMYVVEDGGHAWPGSESTAMSEAVAGRTTQTIDATRVIWDFFEQHSRDG